MTTFSERYNIKPQKMLQINEMDGALSNGIWNNFYTYFCLDDENSSELFEKICAL